MVKFGTGGWRAIIGDEFTKANLRLLTYALARHIKDAGLEKGGVCIGYDRRFLSDTAARWAAEIFAGSGIRVKLLDREAPTPLIMYTVKQFDMNFGIAITASHNPALYNGVKVFKKGGRDADEELTGVIEKYMSEIEAEGTPPENFPSVDFGKAVGGGIVEVADCFNDYIDSIFQSVNMEAIKRRRLKVALDPMYGVSQTSLQTILMTARCDVGVIHERHDALFGGKLPAPNEYTLSSLRKIVLEQNYDLGVATDGDADRIGVIDDNGDFLHPNQILVILYYYLLKYKGWRGPAVRNNSTTALLDKVAAKFGETCYEVPVGFKHISAKMNETGAIIGGESSGGLTVKGHIEGKDGIYASALLAEVIAVSGKRLSDFSAEITELFGKLYTKELEFTFSREKKAELQEKLLAGEPSFPFKIARIAKNDGCKTYFENGGWIIARFSGTEPLLRVCCEMEEEADADTAAAVMREFLGL